MQAVLSLTIVTEKLKTGPFTESGKMTPTILVRLTGSSSDSRGDLSRPSDRLIANRMPTRAYALAEDH